MAGEEYARIHSWGHDPKRKVGSRRSELGDFSLTIVTGRLRNRQPL